MSEPRRSTTSWFYIHTDPIPTQYAAVSRDGDTITINLNVKPSVIAHHRTQVMEEITKNITFLLKDYIGEETDEERLYPEQE